MYSYLGCRKASRSHCQDAAEMVIQTNLPGETKIVRSRVRAHTDTSATALRVSPAGFNLAEKLTTLGRVMDRVSGVNESG